MKIAICGPAQSGKDVAADWFNRYTTLRYHGYSTSSVIKPHVAERLGVTLKEAFERRHQDRELWYEIGEELRRQDKAYLARCVLHSQSIAVGIRSYEEIETCLRKHLVDMAIWIKRDVPPDPTLKYGSEMCDLIIENEWSLSEFHRRLCKLARSWGVLKEQNAYNTHHIGVVA